MWTAIHAIGAAAERRVWTQFGRKHLYPNLFVFLVGPPGVGKTIALTPIADMLRKSQAVGLAPNDMTKQGLLDCLVECAKGAVVNGRPFDYHFMSIIVSEMSNFMSKYDVELTGLLTDLFDCPSINEEKKRSGAGKLIPFPGISMIVGTATKNLGSTISDEMWGSGFMARVILVFSAEEVLPVDMFATVDMDDTLQDQITLRLRKLGDLKGPMIWDAGSREMLKAFRENQKDGAPIHNRLANYVTRRWLHLAKLCMIAGLNHERLTVTADDFSTAYGWLLAAESQMPEIFKDMVHHEDGQIYEELRSHFYHIWIVAKKSIPRSLLFEWLSKRVSSYAVERMLEVALAADYFRRVAGTDGDDALYVPTRPDGVRGPTI